MGFSYSKAGLPRMFNPSYAVSMKAPFHIRGPFMAKIWLLLALTIIGVQMIFVVNLLVRETVGGGASEMLGVEQERVTFQSAPSAVAKAWDASAVESSRNNALYNPRNDAENEIPEAKGVKQPPLENDAGSAEFQQSISGSSGLQDPSQKQDPANSNSQLFDMLQGVLMKSFTNGFKSDSSGSQTALQPAASGVMSLGPLLTLLPVLTGQGLNPANLATVNWENYMPLMERVEKFTKHCLTEFQNTVAEMKKKYPDRAKKPAFVSAVAMKGFFRIFALEEYQEEFLEIGDEALDVLEALGLTDHIIDLVSGRLYARMVSQAGGGDPGANPLNLLGMLGSSKPTPIPKTTTTIPPGEEEYTDDEEEKASFVSNEHFEGIMELYDLMYRDDENTNQTAAKLELSGRVFLQTWYEAMRRYGREKEKIQPKAFTPENFDKYMESIEVPFSNIVDFAYPIRNEPLCKNSSFELLIMVISKFRNAPLRNSIRQSWGSTLPPTVKLVFLLSDREEDRATLEQESGQYGDVITVDVPETYEYTTRKTLVVLDWPVHYCTAPFIFKTTDHMYVNPIVLLEEVRSLKDPSNPVLVGNLVHNSTVQRIPLKLDHLFYDEYPFAVFPDYLKGSGMLMNTEFAKQAINVAKDFPLIRTDDFSLSGIIAAKLKVTPQAFRGSGVLELETAQLRDTQKGAALLCGNKDAVVVGSKLNAPQMLFVHASLRACAVK